MIINCDNCGKEAYKKPYHVKKNKNLFCSPVCHDEFRRKKQYESLTTKVGKDFKTWLESKYWDEELSTRQISKILYGKPSNSPNVLTWLDKMGIPARERTDAVALQWKDNYERRKRQGEVFRAAHEGAVSHRRRTFESIKKEYAAFNMKVLDRYFIDGYTYLECECKVCGHECVKSLGNTSKGCPRCVIASRTFADQTTVKAQRSKTKTWRKKVLKRDKFTCQHCYSKDNLVVHHIQGFATNENLRFELWNGVTLCEDCHREFHKLYGYYDNDLFQFSQFQEHLAIG